MPVVTGSEWDNFLEQHQDVHILQTGAWGLLKQAFGWKVERVIARTASGDIGAQVLFRSILSIFSIAYIPKGPVGMKDCLFPDEAWKALLKEIDEICRERRSIFIKVEPDCWTKPLNGSNTVQGTAPNVNEIAKAMPVPRGFILSTHTIQPPRTIVINLATGEEEILSRMKQKTRYNIRLAQKKGVQVSPSDDLGGFYRLMTTTGERDAFGVHSFEYFKKAYESFEPGNQVELLIASYENQLLAGLMVFRSGQRAWYFYGASSNEKRELMPAYLLQWEAIRWAKARGCVEYDLWGVPDAEENELEAQFSARSDGLWGVYRFKRGFGGELNRSVGPWDRVYQPMLYQVYRWRTSRVSD